MRIWRYLLYTVHGKFFTLPLSYSDLAIVPDTAPFCAVEGAILEGKVESSK